VRPEYVADKLPHLYDGDRLNAALLDPDCIETRDWNLSAGQYKPDVSPETDKGASVSGLIEELRVLELDILARLERLQQMVEARP